MKLRLCAVLGAFTLAACGAGGDPEVALLVDDCVAENANLTQAECSCMANLAKEELSEERFSFLVEMANAEDPAAAFVAAGLDQSDVVAVMQFAQNVESQCRES